MIRTVDISSYHARAALELHGDNTMIRHLISSAIRKPPQGPMPTKLIPAYHECINQYHVDIMNENSYQVDISFKPVSDRITKISSNLTCIVLRIKKWGNTGPEMGEMWLVSTYPLLAQDRGKSSAARFRGIQGKGKGKGTAIHAHQ